MINKTKFLAVAILSAGILSLSQNAFAGNTAEQVVTYEVQAINELSVSAGTATLTVNSATAGSAPNVATDTTTSYAITTNETNRKITGALSANMPTGVVLSATLAAPTGATSGGKLALSTTAADLVTGVATLNESGKGISYELSATSAAGVVPSATKTVTLTITAG
ncbi:MAG: hypothetical protein WDN28_12980 [Chthoniobacter sp.]